MDWFTSYNKDKIKIISQPTLLTIQRGIGNATKLNTLERLSL